jgi:hypothetical protein
MLTASRGSLFTKADSKRSPVNALELAFRIGLSPGTANNWKARRFGNRVFKWWEGDANTLPGHWTRYILPGNFASHYLPRLSLQHFKHTFWSGGQPSASHRDGPGSSPGHVMWDLLWTERHWGRFPPSTLVSPVSHSFHQSSHHCPGLVQQTYKWP